MGTGIPAHFFPSFRRLSPSFLSLGSRAYFAPKNKHQMITALGLAGYQHLLQTFPNSNVDTAQGFVAKCSPQARPSVPRQHSSAVG